MSDEMGKTIIFMIIILFTVFVSCVLNTVFTQNALFLQAANLRMNPLYLMVPTTLASSFAFMLPVATPPNTIVFAYGNLKIKDMVRCRLLNQSRRQIGTINDLTCNSVIIFRENMKKYFISVY